MVHVCMMYTERAETAAVILGTSHVTAKQRFKYIPLRWIFQTRCKKLQSLRVTCDKRALSLLESGERCYIKAINNTNCYYNAATAAAAVLLLLLLLTTTTTTTTTGRCKFGTGKMITECKEEEKRRGREEAMVKSNSQSNPKQHAL